MDIEVAGDADGFGKLAIDIDLNFPPSGYNIGGQVEGVDLIRENKKVALILYSRQIKVVYNPLEAEREMNRNFEFTQQNFLSPFPGVLQWEYSSHCHVNARISCQLQFD